MERSSSVVQPHDHSVGNDRIVISKSAAHNCVSNPALHRHDERADAILPFSVLVDFSRTQILWERIGYE
jgi:hypothetical protein